MTPSAFALRLRDTAASGIAFVGLHAAARWQAAGASPLPLVGPLAGVLLARLPLAELAAGLACSAGLVVALLWVLAPALLDFTPCDREEAAVQ